jgi:cell wall-associated NlpC family hydrolase
MKEIHQRAAVVAEALSWIGTPFHEGANVKGPRGGVDCSGFLMDVYRRAGVIPDPIGIIIKPGHWFLHSKNEHYLDQVRRYFREIDGPPGPGDIAMYKTALSFSHSAIVVDWPTVVHPLWGRCVTTEDASRCCLLIRAPRKFFTFWKGEGESDLS